MPLKLYFMKCYEKKLSQCIFLLTLCKSFVITYLDPGDENLIARKPAVDMKN